MTVGIGAISNDGDDPSLVMAADRMVTLRSSIEYEDTDSKLQTVTEAGPITAVAVGSGSLSLIDELLRQLENKMADDPPTTMRELIELARECYQEIERTSINNNVLSTFDLELSDLSQPSVEFSPEFEDRILNDIGAVRQELRESMNILFGGVSDGTVEIYRLTTPDYNDETSTGYSVIGSGQQSAESLFIRNRYDPDEADISQAIFSVAEAKVQAEERQGVGQRMDMVVVNEDGVRQIEDIEGLRSSIKQIENEQREIRETIIDEW